MHGVEALDVDQWNAQNRVNRGEKHNDAAAGEFTANERTTCTLLSAYAGLVH